MAEILKKHIQRYNLKRALLTGLSLIVVLVILGLLAETMFNRSPVSNTECKQKYQSANDLIDKNQYKDALRDLKPTTQDCTLAYMRKGLSSKNILEWKVTAIEYNASLANASFGNGDTKSALSFAKAALRINGELNPSQRQTIPDQQGVILTMLSYVTHFGTKNSEPNQ